MLVMLVSIASARLENASCANVSSRTKLEESRIFVKGRCVNVNNENKVGHIKTSYRYISQWLSVQGCKLLYMAQMVSWLVVALLLLHHRYQLRIRP